MLVHAVAASAECENHEILFLCFVFNFNLLNKSHKVLIIWLHRLFVWVDTSKWFGTETCAMPTKMKRYRCSNSCFCFQRSQPPSAIISFASSASRFSTIFRFSIYLFRLKLFFNGRIWHLDENFWIVKTRLSGDIQYATRRWDRLCCGEI